ncbi:putative dapper 1-like [Scophthalmus maximus]|uniref:Putative dapper 1-like n=1 Tax=Scophthalmus maximus TaxID=52904 RepID=A0A2U9B6K9_SCOMX|nr:putative dapper 1-like [Scophthalmus maximus]
MHRAFSFPVTVERSRTKERLEASLAGLCELELRKQRQECLVLGALALGEPLARGSCRGELACFSSWGQENLTLRRQLSALQSSPWGLMQALEQQVGELRVDADDGGCYDGAQADAGDSRPSSGFYESSEGQSPKGRSCSTEPAETVSSWVHTSDRPKSVGDPVMSTGEADVPVLHAALPRSFSAPYPPLEGIAEEGPALDAWQGDPGGDDHAWRQQQQEPAEDEVTEEDYQQALRVENYILALLHRHTLSSRPCQPRTTLSPDPPYCSASAHGSLHRRTPSLTSEQRPSDPPNGPGWGCDRLEGEACGGEAPSFEEDCYLALPYPQSRPHSLAGRLPSPLPSLDPNCGAGALDLCCEPASPQHYLHPQPPFHHKHNLVSAQYIPGQGCHAPVRSPRHYNPEQAKPNRPAAASPDRHPNAKSRPSKKTHAERQRGKKSGGKTNRSQSENSLLGQRVLPERRYSTTERHGARGDVAQNQGPVAGPQGGQRWCSNLELSQDEGEGEGGYAAGAAPAESESSMSEVYSPASSSLSSDSDESGGLSNIAAAAFGHDHNVRD